MKLRRIVLVFVHPALQIACLLIEVLEICCRPLVLCCRVHSTNGPPIVGHHLGLYEPRAHLIDEQGVFLVLKQTVGGSGKERALGIERTYGIGIPFSGTCADVGYFPALVATETMAVRSEVFVVCGKGTQGRCR